MALDYFDRIEAAAAYLRQRIGQIPSAAVVLGSGLGAFADRLTDPICVPYADIPHWPAATVVGHAGVLVRGTAGGTPVLTLAGRAHFYEGHDLRTVTFATRVLGLLGVKTLVLTNAAGGINTSFSPGTLMVIDDHINLMGSNPLVGPNDDRFGARFPDMTTVYSTRLRAIADEAAAYLRNVESHFDVRIEAVAIDAPRAPAPEGGRRACERALDERRWSCFATPSRSEWNQIKRRVTAHLAEGKPEAMLEKIAQGKLQKFYKDSTLLNQEFVKDSSLTIRQLLEKTAKGLTVTTFKRIAIGG